MTSFEKDGEHSAFSKVLISGRPTGPEVEKLMKAWPKLKQNDKITYEEIEAVIGYERKESRFRCVVDSWRRRLYREYNLILDSVHAVGYEVLDGAGRVDKASRVMKAGIRRVRRAGNVAIQTDKATLSAADISACDHIIRASAAIVATQKEEARRLRLSTLAIAQN